ncbi:MAG: histidine phosphatase family protein [Aestuariibacter sp.]
MKQLLLCRHAKSSWKHNVEDLYRPLNARGLRQAPRIAQTLTFKPELIICSPAIRAYATALAYCHELHWDPQDININQQLYEAGLTQLLKILKDIPDKCDSVMLIGHNPGFNQLLSYLAPDNDIDNVVTSARVDITLEIETWRMIDQSCGTVSDITTPLSLGLH